MFRAGLRRARTLGRRLFALNGRFFQVGRKTKTTPGDAPPTGFARGPARRVKAGKINALDDVDQDGARKERDARPRHSNYNKCKL
jgi:hypothetical protein